MWTGVNSGLDLLKFSTSPKTIGKFEEIKTSIKTIAVIDKKSLFIIEGLNFILSEFSKTPIGVEEPVEWRKIKWKITIADITNGKM